MPQDVPVEGNRYLHRRVQVTRVTNSTDAGTRCGVRIGVHGDARQAGPRRRKGRRRSGYCVIAARAAAERNIPPAEWATPGTTLMVWRS